MVGKEQVDLLLLVKKLKDDFKVNVLSVHGGATINWTFLQAGIVDELSICMAAAADGANDTLTLFEKSPYALKDSPIEFELKSADKISNGGLWLRYTPKKSQKKEIPYLGQFETGPKNEKFAEFFSGQSYISLLSDKGALILNVTFEPECRNNWHIHHGIYQILLCTSGFGWYQEDGKEPRLLKPGDVVEIPPEVKHWHGAMKDSWFSHISVQPKAPNSSTEWLEAVSDEHYNGLALNK